MTHDVAEWRRRVDRAGADYAAARAMHRDAKQNHAAVEQRVADTRAALELTQGVAAAVQAAAHKRIAEVVTRSLAAVFPEPYGFRITFETKRGKTEAKLEFVRDGMAVAPMDAAGGGVVDVAAFALRLSAVLWSRPPKRRLLVLDEPLKHLSRDYTDRARVLLETLAAELGVQIVLVTHNDGLATGEVIRL